MIDNKVEEIKAHIEAISKALGIPVTPSNANTPLRVAKMLCNEVFANRNDAHLEGLDSSMKTFPSEGYYGPITVNGIKFSSTCEHHWMPFMGTVSVTYIPDGKIVGLSKIPRVVRYFSKRPQLQERFTHDIGKYLVDLLDPMYLRVEVDAIHTCVMCRGAESESSTHTEFEYHKEI